MIIFLITSVEAVAYWTPDYYEKEYEKYGVAEDVNMEMEDLLDVTQEMMAFLRGKRADLHVPTTVGGAQRDFSMNGRSPIWSMCTSLFSCDRHPQDLCSDYPSQHRTALADES